MDVELSEMRWREEVSAKSWMFINWKSLDKAARLYPKRAHVDDDSTLTEPQPLNLNQSKSFEGAWWSGDFSIRPRCCTPL